MPSRIPHADLSFMSERALLLTGGVLEALVATGIDARPKVGAVVALAGGSSRAGADVDFDVDVDAEANVEDEAEAEAATVGVEGGVVDADADSG